MMPLIEKSISPSNLQFYISDLSIPESPEFDEVIGIVSNGLSVIVPCQYYWEGDTEVVIGDYTDVPKNGVLAFEVSIPTPGGYLLVSDVGLEELMKFPVSKNTSHLTIWTDGQQFPARVVVGVK